MKRLIIMTIAMATFTTTFANKIENISQIATTLQDDVNETTKADSTSNEETNLKPDNMTDTQDSNKTKAPTTEKDSNTTMYMIVGALVGAAAYAGYRRWRNNKAVDMVNDKLADLVERPEIRIIRHKELSYNYLISNDAKECLSVGATEMNIFMAKAFTASHPELRQILIDINDNDINTAIIVVGLNEDKQDVYTVVHCATKWDEQLKASVNDKDILTIKLK